MYLLALSENNSRKWIILDSKESFNEGFYVGVHSLSTQVWCYMTEFYTENKIQGSKWMIIFYIGSYIDSEKKLSMI
jgi:hypothetical protein